MPSGGVLSLSDPVDNVQLTQEEMNAIVSEAHAWKRKVAAHCDGDRAAKMAIAAGVDSIEHGSFLQDDTLLEMKKKHVYLVATLFAGVWLGEHADTFPAPIAAKARAAAAQAQTMFQHTVKIGVPLAMGTDAGVEPHGMNAREFVMMARNGLPAAQVLMAGTAESEILAELRRLVTDKTLTDEAFRAKESESFLPAAFLPTNSEKIRFIAVLLRLIRVTNRLTDRKVSISFAAGHPLPTADAHL